MNTPTQTFLAGNTFAVAGASTQPEKYGNKVLRALLNSGRTTYPLNPKADTVEGQQAYASLADLPEVPESLSVVTPPEVTKKIVAAAIQAGVKNIWMQPGAEHPDAIEAAQEAGLNVIGDGSCVLVSLSLEGNRPT